MGEAGCQAAANGRVPAERPDATGMHSTAADRNRLTGSIGGPND